MSVDPNRALRQILTSLHQAGVTHVAKPVVNPNSVYSAQEPAREPDHQSPNVVANVAAEQSVEQSSSPDAATSAGKVAPDHSVDLPNSPPATLFKAPAEAVGILSLNERNDSLEILRTEVANCEKCEELAASRTQIVFGVGNPQARLVFLGEAPGAEEDRQGMPFVGRAGQKLTEIIEKGMKLKREDVYILNVLKCRPPGNRNPAEHEARNCRGFLDRQLQIIRPEFLCCLGGVAATNLLDSKLTIGKLRGKFYDYDGVQVMVTYHPAYLLRNPSARTQVWEDIKMLMEAMGIQ